MYLPIMRKYLLEIEQTADSGIILDESAMPSMVIGLVIRAAINQTRTILKRTARRETKRRA